MKTIIFLLIFLNPFLLFSQTDSLGGKVPTVYSKNYKERAVTLQRLVSSAEIFYEKLYPQYTFKVVLRVLDSADWQKSGNQNLYGMPHYRNDLFIGADKDALFNDNTSDNEVSIYDMIAVHELGHYFMGDLVKTDIYPNWANEFIADYFQVGYTESKKIKFKTEKNEFIPAHRTLDDFEKGFQYVGGAEAYGWFQNQFTKLSRRLYARHKFKVLNKFIDNYKPGGKQKNALNLLLEIDKNIVTQWLQEMR